MAWSERTYRDALGHFATGVAVLSGRHGDGAPVGLTINSFSSVSLDPRIVVFSVNSRSPSLGCFEPERPFAISLLAAAHEEVSAHFARPQNNKWGSVSHVTWDHGCPIVAGCLAAFEGLIHSRVEVGDHWVLFGNVQRMAVNSGLDPLLFFRGRYRSLREAVPA